MNYNQSHLCCVKLKQGNYLPEVFSVCLSIFWCLCLPLLAGVTTGDSEQWLWLKSECAYVVHVLKGGYVNHFVAVFVRCGCEIEKVCASSHHVGDSSEKTRMRRALFHPDAPVTSWSCSLLSTFLKTHQEVEGDGIGWALSPLHKRGPPPF